MTSYFYLVLVIMLCNNLLSALLTQSGNALSLPDKETEVGGRFVKLFQNTKTTYVLSDVDGTLLRSDHSISDDTIRSIKSVMENNFKFIPCTGRTRKSMCAAAGKDFMNLFGDRLENIPGVYQQGLMVYNLKGELIHERFLENDPLEKVVKFCDANGLSVIAYCGEVIYCRENTPQTRKIVEYSEPIPDVFPEGLENLAASGIVVHKLIILAEDEELNRIRPSLEIVLGSAASITKAVAGMLEVLPANSSKGEGVKILLDYLGVDSDNCIGFGDGENDIEFLQLVGAGIAVDNAKPKLKSVADLLTWSNDDNGVARVLDILISVNREKLKQGADFMQS